MGVKSFQDLFVWQKSMDLVTEVYKLISLLPKTETFALSDQMKRSAVSVSSNIAEGFGRGSRKEFLHFLSIASGSKAELQTQILICERLNYLTREQTNSALLLIEEISKMIYSLKNAMNRS